MNKIDEIDQMIASLYSDKEYGELDALSKLFSSSFLDNLEDLLNKNCRNDDTYSDKYEIKEGWIDKIPLAKFVNKTYDINNNEIHRKVELGDFLLIYTHQQKNRTLNSSKPVLLDSRALIIQAKIAQVAFPNVPIGKIDTKKVSSTSKELALLSNWPEFDLYKSSRSKDALHKGIKLNATKSKAKFAGYFEKLWYIGNPKFNDKCSGTLGQLIVEMMTRKVGEKFSINDDSSDWNKLINTIINLCGDSYLPFSLFKSKKRRFMKSSYLFSTPILSFFFFFFFPEPKFRLIVINRISSEGRKS